LRKLTSSSYLEFKIRVPTLDGDSFVGLASDYTERLSANIVDAWSLEPSYLYESNIGTSAYFRIKPDAALLIDSGDNFGDDFEALFNLSGAIGYKNENIDLNGGLTSATIITDDADSFSDRSIWQAFATVTYKASHFEPGLIIRLPLNGGFNDIYSTIIGAHIGYRFGGASDSMPVGAN